MRYADLRGYQYDRRDVTGRGLANAYAQTLGTIFTESGKPYEVELVVAEVVATQSDDSMYRLTYDGSVTDEHGFVVMGGHSDPVATYLRGKHDPAAALDVALRLGLAALAQPVADGAETRVFTGDALEAAVLDRTRPRRAFKRLIGERLDALIAPSA